MKSNIGDMLCQFIAGHGQSVQVIIVCRTNEEQLIYGMTRHQEIACQLERAMHNEEFSLVYQPQVNLLTNKLMGAEALLRWHNHQLGKINPAEFIPIAESTGFIHQLGEWVLKAAVKQSKAWQMQGYSPLRIAVNLSRKQLEAASIVERIQAAIAEEQLLPQNFELEITENVMLQAESSIQYLHQLQQLGMVIAMDDFGTGYSSLSSLKQLPIRKIKIDQSFVKQMTTSKQDVHIINSMIQLAHTLELDVIAEGIETEEQLGALVALGCSEGQGYLFDKPLLPEKFAEKYLI